MDFVVRKVFRGNKKKDNYLINLPKEFVKDLKLQNSNIMIEKQGNSLIITKINESSQSREDNGLSNDNKDDILI